MKKDMKSIHEKMENTENRQRSNRNFSNKDCMNFSIKHMKTCSTIAKCKSKLQ